MKKQNKKTNKTVEEKIANIWNRRRTAIMKRAAESLNDHPGVNALNPDTFININNKNVGLNAKKEEKYFNAAMKKLVNSGLSLNEAYKKLMNTESYKSKKARDLEYVENLLRTVDSYANAIGLDRISRNNKKNETDAIWQRFRNNKGIFTKNMFKTLQYAGKETIKGKLYRVYTMQGPNGENIKVLFDGSFATTVYVDGLEIPAGDLNE